MGFYTRVSAPTIFALTRNDPEPAHRLGIFGLKALSYQPLYGMFRVATTPFGLQTRAFGMTFDTPVGIAAGFDKHAEAVTGASALGVGHSEVGTIVPRPQTGNSRPRLSRDVPQQTLRNWYGFNSDGAVKAASNLLMQRPGSMRVGVNVGANKDTPIDEMHLDYLFCIDKLHWSASYFTINVSSPNTPGLRTLQEPDRIDKLLAHVEKKLYSLADLHGRRIPYVVKTANDLPVEATLEVAECVFARGGAGMIVGNTRMVEREGGVAGESGPHLFEHVGERIEAIKKKIPQLDLVWTGGINSPERAWTALQRGATLCQVYTGMVYEGPLLFNRINTYLLKRKYRQKF